MDAILKFVANLVFTTHQEITQNGITYLVANGVPIVEGVLNGHLVPADEFGQFVHDWNGIDLVMRHPEKNNGTAKVPNPDVQVLGRFYHASLDNERRALVGEYWFDKNALMSTDLGKIVLNRILAGTMIETSTGYFAQTEMKVGVFKGTPYIGIHRNVHPDHIAILPDQIGACSVKDGCGINRNSALSNSEISLNCQESCSGNCPLKKPVVQKTKENRIMDIEKILQMVANMLSVGKRKVTVKKNVAADGTETYDLVSNDEVPAIPPAGSGFTLPPGLQALSNWFDSMGPEKMASLFESLPKFQATLNTLAELTPKIEAVINSQAVAEKTEKDTIISELVANKALGVTKEQLEEMPLPALVILRKASKPVVVSQKGRGISSVVQAQTLVQNEDEDDEEPTEQLERPSFLLNKNKKKQPSTAA